MLKEQILALVRRYLERQIDRSAFSEQFAGLYLQVRNSRVAPAQARNLCNSLMLPFAELSRGHRIEESFRQELANAIRPFASAEVLRSIPANGIVFELSEGPEKFVRPRFSWVGERSGMVTAASSAAPQETQLIFLARKGPKSASASDVRAVAL